MVDFACWGVNPHSTRKALAESANKWSGACAAALTGGAIHRRISADGTTAADYDTSSSPSPLNCTVCAPTPGQVTNLQVETANGGADLFFTWTDLPAANDYVVFEDAAPDDVFSTEAGTATSGVSGLTIPMPPGTKFYLVAGRNITCGLGPKH